MKPSLTILTAAAAAATLSLVPTARTAADTSPAPLDARVTAAIVEALQDERRGEDFYARVLKDHGDVRPFVNVVRAEARHAGFLVDLLAARELSVPAREKAEAPAHASIKEACAAAVVFEANNVALYDRLLAAGPLPDDVRRVFEHNRIASLDRHKPAFERCASGATARAAGPGLGRGRGHGCSDGVACERECRCGDGCGHGCGHRHARHACRRP